MYNKYAITVYRGIFRSKHLVANKGFQDLKGEDQTKTICLVGDFNFVVIGALACSSLKDLDNDQAV